LPGLHGDWTVVGNFRRALGGKVRFAEITYPRTLTWSLEDYARAVEDALVEEGITGGWFLAESFSSLVLWQLLARKRVCVDGVILVGGFARHPMRWGARLMEKIFGILPASVFRQTFIAYGKLARFRLRRLPEAGSDLAEFMSRRTDLDRLAMKHRLHLVSQADFCHIAKDLNAPVYAMTGLFDPIVPWFAVRRWLRNNCAGLREYKIIPGCDHNVLGNAPRKAASQVGGWIEKRGTLKGGHQTAGSAAGHSLAEQEPVTSVPETIN
jgi:pimeloyl-ACP methyl ester carboxylesterase